MLAASSASNSSDLASQRRLSSPVDSKAGSNDFPPSSSLNLSASIVASGPISEERRALAAIAAERGRALHDICGDGNCQPRAILDALNHQLDPPRAVGLDHETLRNQIVDLIDQSVSPELLGRVWNASGDNDAVPLSFLKDQIKVWAERNNLASIEEYAAYMRSASLNSTASSSLSHLHTHTTHDTHTHTHMHIYIRIYPFGFPSLSGLQRPPGFPRGARGRTRRL